LASELCQTVGDEFFFTLHNFLEVGKTQDSPSKFWQTLGDALRVGLRACIHRDKCACVVIVSGVLYNSKEKMDEDRFFFDAVLKEMPGQG
jgi:hypothetical protein